MLIARETFFAGDRKITTGDVVDDKDPIVDGRRHLFAPGRGELSPVQHYPPRPVDPASVPAGRRSRGKKAEKPADTGAPPAADSGDAKEAPASKRPASARRGKKADGAAAPTEETGSTEAGPADPAPSDGAAPPTGD